MMMRSTSAWAWGITDWWLMFQASTAPARSKNHWSLWSSIWFVGKDEKPPNEKSGCWLDFNRLHRTSKCQPAHHKPVSTPDIAPSSPELIKFALPLPHGFLVCPGVQLRTGGPMLIPWEHSTKQALKGYCNPDFRQWAIQYCNCKREKKLLGWGPINSKYAT